MADHELHGDLRAGTVSPDLLQVLINLIGNACKYSQAGTVVRVSAERGDGEVVFRVADRGRGIPPDRLEVIF